MGIYGRDVELEAELIMSLSVDISEPDIVGQTHRGYLKVIPITGGSFCGERLNGKIIPGGADWNTVLGDYPDSLSAVRHIFAKYTIATDDGAVISVENEGWKPMNADKSTAISTVPKLETADKRYRWLNYGVYVGSLTPRAQGGGVELNFYRMK